MLRHMIAASAALALFAGAAVAEPVGPVEKTIRQGEHGTHITKRFVNHRGEMVTKHKVIRYDGTVGRSRSVRDPMTGSVTRMRRDNY
jgi:hypothetical protein